MVSKLQLSLDKTEEELRQQNEHIHHEKLVIEKARAEGHDITLMQKTLRSLYHFREGDKAPSSFDFLNNSGSIGPEVLRSPTDRGPHLLPWRRWPTEDRRWMWAIGHNGDIKRAAHGYEPYCRRSRGVGIGNASLSRAL